MIRLVTPWAPQSGVSLHNLLPAPSSRGYWGRLTCDEPAAATTGKRVTGGSARGVGQSVAEATRRFEAESYPEPLAGWLKGQAMTLLSLLWLAGVLGLTSCIAVSAFRLRRIVRRGRLVTDPWILDILEECRQLMGTRAPVAVTATDKVRCPALCGICRPRLLMPERALLENDGSELRHIFLHELAHLRRHDILVGHVSGLLHILHWFNPVIALGLRRMRADRELACDGLVLSRLAPHETRAYGHTIVRQIERLVASRRRLVLPGLCGDRGQIKQRIAMVAQFHHDTYHRSHLTLVLVGVLAVVGLTNARTTDDLSDSISSPPVPPATESGDAQVLRAQELRSTPHQDKHGNIIRIHLRHRESGKYMVADGGQITCDADEPGEAGLWEARFDDDLGFPQYIVYFYSVGAGGYLVADEQPTLAIKRGTPDETARWTVCTCAEGTYIRPYRREDASLFCASDGSIRVWRGGRGPAAQWEIDQIWRVKVSDKPTSNAEWRRKHVPGPD